MRVGHWLFWSLAGVGLGACGSSSDDAGADGGAGDAGTAPAAFDDTHGGALPAIEGPVRGGNGSPWVQSTSIDLGALGYRTDEYFLSGTARSYAAVGELGEDGDWQLEADGSAAYRTRIVVYRPRDEADFNGSVMVEWLNVSGGLDTAPDWTSGHTELIRAGWAWVGVSAQSTGIEGGGANTGFGGLGDLSLKGFDAERYGTLDHPGDEFSYDMFSQVGRVLTEGGDGEVDPLGGLSPQRLIAAGESQSAFRLVTHINGVDPLVPIYDGFLVHSRGGDAAPLGAQAGLDADATVRIRSDVRVPVLTFQTETDILDLSSINSRQDDSERLRLWEVPGTAHADLYSLWAGTTDAGDDPSMADVVVTNEPIPGIVMCDEPINAGPQHFVLNAAIAALDAWVRDGTPPPMADRIDVEGEPPMLSVDAHGNVTGGIRTPHTDVPTAVLSGTGQTPGGFCGLFGTTVAFDADKLASLYADRDDYATRVAAAADEAVAAGFLLESDADLIRRAAEMTTLFDAP